METKIEQLQAEIDAINSFDKRHTICSSNYIIELGYEEGKVSAAEKQNDGSWKFVSGIEAPHLSFTGNIYILKDWYINKPNVYEDWNGPYGQWYKINGLTGFSRKNALLDIINHIKFIEFSNKTFATMYHDLYIMGDQKLYEDVRRAREDFEGHSTEYFWGHPEDENQAWPVEDRVRYLKKQIEKLKRENEIANATGYMKIWLIVKKFINENF